MSGCISYENTNRFKPLFIDYINQKLQVSSFYNRFPGKENFIAQIEEKQKNYNTDHREILVDQLNEQYKGLDVSELTKKHIQQLANDHTFTITTGHQLNVFTGPLYTFYKIISVINSCKILNQKYPEFSFVPVFWLASEDHDFEEINHFHLHSKTLSWNKKASGSVGELHTDGLREVFEQFKSVLPKGQSARDLIDLFQKSYLEHESLSSATIHLYNALFGEHGLVIIEPNQHDLKTVLRPYIKEELFSNTTHAKVSESSRSLKSLGYHEQVTPREINYFYKKDNLRERLIQKDERFFVNNTGLSFSADDILKEIDQYPERFSPNALLRPLYQEVLLPNLSYVGGAGELAYWLQLKTTFEAFKVTFPMLQMRNSALLYSEKTFKKLDKLNIKLVDLFQSPIDLKNQHVKAISKIDIDFTAQKKYLSRQFDELYQLAQKTDKSFLNAVAAQEKKQHNGLDKLERRLLKAQRRKLEDETERLIFIQDKLFPQSNLQERYVNFSDIYLTYGHSFLDFVMDHLDPFQFKFSLLELSTSPKSIPDKFTTDCI
jgi:bacillithiol biosynthesis cysteine-adding enzyme BshC